MKKRNIAVATAVIAIAAGLGWYFILGAAVKTGVKLEVEPSPIRLGDRVTWTISVTNGEATTMTITGLTISVYRDGQFLDTDTEDSTSPDFITTTVPPGENVVIFRKTEPGPTSPEHVGKYRFELTCHTNFGDLKTVSEVTVSP